jgi:hypothetical protein
VNGAIDEDLLRACPRALTCAPEAARRLAQRYSWETSHQLFRAHLVPLSPAARAARAS